MMPTTGSLDYLLVGGGLQSGLMALAIRHHQPQARVAIIESGSELGGNHTWSFHASDVPAACAAWVEPLVASRWPRYDIRVGGRQQTVDLEYFSTSSAHFASVVTQQLSGVGCRVLTDTTAVELNPGRVTIHESHSRQVSQLEAAVVFDNRGPSRIDLAEYAGGFQKFWGFEVALDSDWPLENPVVMDDRVEQSDGFRFIYSLPLERRRVLVEDTRFSNTPSLDRDECLEQVQRYLSRLGIGAWQIVREETGVLPMPTGGPLPGSGLAGSGLAGSGLAGSGLAESRPLLAGGYRGGWFHAATGYSFPMAVLVADTVARTPVAELPDALQRLSQAQAWRARFARFLNRLLFDLVKPQTRYQIFRRFYQVLDEPRIARFYGHRFTPYDAFRIVVGVPPRGLRPVNFFRSFVASRNRQTQSVAPTIVNGVSL